MMEKYDWYVDRILWKAKKNNLFEKKCSYFSNLSNDQKSIIYNTVPVETVPILVFWKDESTWTFLDGKHIYSCHSDNLVSCDLDDIEQQMTLFIPDGMDTQEAKLKSEFIVLKASEKLVWVPSGAELFALMNILRMFPLNTPL